MKQGRHYLLIFAMLLCSTTGHCDEIITFADDLVRLICVTQWDTNTDGDLSKDEAAVVTSLGTVFKETAIVSFDELQYFTGLSSIATNAFQKCTSLESIVIPANVTQIGNGAFNGCTSLASIDLANVDTIKMNAFNNCTGLTSLKIPASMNSIDRRAFNGCDSLKRIEFECPEIGVWFDTKDYIEEVVIGSGVTTIAKTAFKHCNGLRYVNIPDNVTSIGYGAFSNCENLVSATLGNGISEISQSLFDACTSLKSVVIPATVTKIGGSAFSGCTALSSIDLANVDTIKMSAFNNCTGLTSLKIPASMKSIDQAAFNGCDSLKKIEFECPEIGGSWFSGKDYVEEIVIGSGVTTIAKTAFQYCDGLMSVNIPDNVTSIGVSAFSNCKNLLSATLGNGISEISQSLFDACTSLKSVVIPATVTKIGGSAFSGCTALSSIDLANVDTIKMSAFNNCTGLTSLKIPASMKSIDQAAFNGCDSLKKIEFECPEIGGSWFSGKDYVEEIVIGSGVTTIAKTAFQYCDGLTSVYIPANVKSIGPSAFNSDSLKEVWTDNPLPVNIVSSVFNKNTYTNGVLYILSKSIDTYKESESWNKFKDIEGGWFFVTVKANTGGKAVFADHLVTDDESFSTYVKRGNDTIITVVPNEGYELKSMTVNDEETISEVKDSILSISNILTDIDAVATFKKLTFKIMTTVGDGGSLVASSDIVEWSDDATIKVIPDKNYGLESLLVNGEDKSLEFKDSVLTISDIKTNVSVEATFKLVAVVEDEVIYAVNEDETVTVQPSLEENMSVEIDILATVKIGEKEYTVTTIAEGAFEDNTIMEKLKIPESIVSIGASAFSGCINLKVIFIFAKEPINLSNAIAATRTRGDESSSVFNGVETESCILYVPVGSKEKYEQADGWKDFKHIVEMVGLKEFTIGKNGKTTFCGTQALDFSYSDEVKAFIATGFDKTEGTIWMTRVKDVPAGVPVMIKGTANETYHVPVTVSGSSYYRNMFVGNTSGESMSIGETSEDGKYVNYYMSGGQFKSVNTSANIGANKCYLQLPATFAAEATGDGYQVKIAASGKSSFAAPYDLDFTSLNDDVKAFTATGYDASTKTIWLTRVKKVQKGEGLLLKGTGGETYTIPSSGVQAAYENMIVGNIGDEITINGTSEDGTLTNYYLKGGTYMSVSGSANIGTNKSYLQLPTSMLAGTTGARSEDAPYSSDVLDNLGTPSICHLAELETESMPVVFAETTGIKDNNRETITNNRDGQWFTLGGQRIDKPTRKGLYIHNGRKVVIR